MYAVCIYVGVHHAWFLPLHTWTNTKSIQTDWSLCLFVFGLFELLLLEYSLNASKERRLLDGHEAL